MKAFNGGRATHARGVAVLLATFLLAFALVVAFGVSYANAVDEDAVSQGQSLSADGGSSAAADDEADGSSAGDADGDGADAGDADGDGADAGDADGDGKPGAADADEADPAGEASSSSSGGGLTPLADSTHVARVGEEGYSTVQLAIDNADEGQTVTVLADFDEKLTISKAITLDLNGHKYTYTGAYSSYSADGAITIMSGHIVPTIKNGTIYGCNLPRSSRYVIRASSSGVNLDNVTFTGNSGSSSLVSITDNSATTELAWTNVTFEGNSSTGVVSISYKANSTLTNCTFKGNTGSGQVLSLGGNGSPTLNNCSFTDNSNAKQVVNNSADIVLDNCTLSDNTSVRSVIYAAGYYGKGSIKMTDCQVTDNSVSEYTVYSHYAVYLPTDKTTPSLTLTRTVVKDNTSSADLNFGCAGIYSNYWGTTFDDSAVYHNTNTSSDGSIDLAFWALGIQTALLTDDENTNRDSLASVGIDISKMKDPTDSSMNFAGYSVGKRGQVIKSIVIYEAQIDDTQYSTFADAWDEVQDGQTIQVITTDGGDLVVEQSALGSLDTTGKDVTIDLNGRSLKEDDGGTSLTLAGNGAVNLTNGGEKASTVKGEVVVSGSASLTVGENVELASPLVSGGGAVTISGAHQNVLISYPALYDDEDGTATVGSPVNFAEDFSFTGTGENDQKFAITLSNDALLAALNDNVTEVDDFVVANGLTEDAAMALELSGVTNPLVTLVTANGVTSVHKEIGTFVYLDGQNGSDEADGLTKGTAVQTFERAREIIDSQTEDGTFQEDRKAYIIVCGTVAVADSETWGPSEEHRSTKITLLREASFKGNLVSVSGTDGSLTLQDVTLDGNASHAGNSAALVKVDGGKLAIADGAALQNNQIATAADGGAVNVSNGGSVTMSGGTISNNKATMIESPGAAGGVYVGSGGSFDMTGGTISGNASLRGSAVQLGGSSGKTATFTMSGGTISDNTYFKGKSDETGGAVYVGYYSNFELSGGTLANNEGYQGGAVSVSDRGSENPTAMFTMTGGTISDNSAYTGGGIYSYSNGVKLLGGTISGNTARDLGGGVYSEGNSYHWSSLTISDALVTGNSASEQGGGVWVCPTGSALLNGSVAVFGNTSDKVGDDFVSAAVNDNKSGNTLATRILGGGIAQWYKDGNVTRGALTDQIPGVGDDPRYDADEPGDSITIELDHGLRALKSVVDEGGQAAAKDAAKLVIEGNTAVRGGGIGMNGGVDSDEPETAKIQVKKTWEDGDAPTSLTVHLWLNDRMVQTESLTADGEWSFTFDDVPATIGGKATSVKVTEELPTGWRQDSVQVSDGEELKTDENGYAEIGSSTRDYAQIWTFKNVYAPDQVTVDPPAVTKTVAGDTPAEYPSFDFTLTARDGAPMPEGSADGKSITKTLQSASEPTQVEFGAITYDTAGTYVYDIVEVEGSQAGWTYDTSAYVLTVTVTDEGGVLSASESITRGDETVDSVVFTNSYQAEDNGGTSDDDDSGSSSGGKSSSGKDGDSSATGKTARTADDGLALAMAMAAIAAASLAGAVMIRRREMA